MGIILFIQRIASPFFDGFFQAVTMLGEEYFYIVLMALIGAVSLLSTHTL